MSGRCQAALQYRSVSFGVAALAIVYPAASIVGAQIGMLKSGWRRAAPGAVLAAGALLAFYAGRGLSYGTAEHVGPGFVPAILTALLFILGLTVAAERLWPRPASGEE
jgi:hypothetical protein